MNTCAKGIFRFQGPFGVASSSKQGKASLACKYVCVNTHKNAHSVQKESLGPRKYAQKRPFCAKGIFGVQKIQYVFSTFVCFFGVFTIFGDEFCYIYAGV